MTKLSSKFITTLLRQPIDCLIFIINNFTCGIIITLNAKLIDLITKQIDIKVGCSEYGDTCVQLLVSPYESTSYFYTVLTLHFEKL